MNLLFGHDKTVADWVSKKQGKPLRNWHHAVGILDKDGLLIGCASFHDFNGSNIEICYFGPGSPTASIARGLMRFAFEGLKVSRVTARTPRANKRIIQALPAFGFKMEGVMKHYYGPFKRFDAIVFGLLASDATRFIR